MSVTLRDLRKTFAGKAAVDGISAHVATGEFFAIVGASGCGKSTLLRLIAGLERVDGGEIALGEDTVSGEGRHVAPEARGVGFVFQSYALWPHLDVRGNVAFPAEAAGLGRADAARQADRHLATVALDGFRHPQTRRPLRRAAAARGARPMPGSGGADDPDGRAAGQSRPAFAAGDGRGTGPVPPLLRGDDALHHP
jgi:iron(III) transport system ATP-binding protein